MILRVVITTERGTAKTLRRQLDELLGPVGFRVTGLLHRTWQSITFEGLRYRVFIEGNIGEPEIVYQIVAEAEYRIPYFLGADAFLVSSRKVDGKVHSVIEFLLLREDDHED